MPVQHRAGWHNMCVCVCYSVFLPGCLSCRYFLSTALGLFNKKVVGKKYGVLGKGAFPGGCAHVL